MIGKTISHYRILDKLGEGGMGVVYKAEDTKLKRTVALKFLPREYSSDIAAKERFVHEAQAASALDHPNICTIHEIGETDDNQSYIAMACYEGQSLKSKIDNSQLTIEESIDITIQIAKGLKRAHEAGIVHRDIKPANIIITEHNEVKILDFGLAKLAGQTRLTKEGMTVGTIAYMSPEQAHGNEVDHRSDIWSLGVILYEMLSGQLPFKGDYEQAIIYSLINEEPLPVSVLNEDISQELENIVQKCLAKNPDQRYQTIEELLIDFKPFSSEAAVSIDESISGILKRLWRKKIVRRISAAASILVTMAIFYILFWPKITEPTPIAIISFKNQTGDTKYDILSKSIPNLLITSLEQSGHFRVVTWERLNELKKQLGKDSLEFIDSELGIQLCSMLGIPNIVVGSIAKIGDIFATDIKVLDVKTKGILQSAQSKGEGENSILKSQIDDLTRDITIDFGGLSEEKFAESHSAITEITTPSMEAYNYYLRGLEENSKKQYNDAIKFVKKAIELDTTYSTAFRLLGACYGWRGDLNLCKQALEKAKKYGNNKSELERLFNEMTYTWFIEKNVEKWDNMAIQRAKKYPNDPFFLVKASFAFQRKNQHDEAIAVLNKAIEHDPYLGTAYEKMAYIYIDLENYDKALEYLKKYASVNPGDANPHEDMADLYFYMGDLDQAIVKYKEALFIKPDFISGEYLCHVYALKENYTEALKSLDDWISQLSGGPKSTGYYKRGFYNAWLGKFEQSCQDINEEIKNDEIIGQSVGWQFWRLGYYYYESGKLDRSRQAFNNYLNLAYKQDSATARTKVHYYFGLALLDLKQGKIDSARYRLTEMETHLPNIKRSGSREGANIYFQTLLSEILMAENKLDKTVIEYKKIPLYDHPWSLYYNNIPFTRDVGARAYARMGKIDEAIAEYERLITFDPKSKDRRLIHPKYHYRLAKLYEQTDQLEKAIKEYDKFLDLWKNADKDQPDLIDAKKRLADLVGKY